MPPMGFAALYPSYASRQLRRYLPHPLGGQIVGLTPGPGAKFVRRYADLRSVLTSAVQEWAGDVVSGAYPDAEHTYH